MKYELTKTEHPMFSEYYEGYNPMTQRRVICILDDNCVRYTVLVKSGRLAREKVQIRREYANTNKARCMANASDALNR